MAEAKNEDEPKEDKPEAVDDTKADKPKEVSVEQEKQADTETIEPEEEKEEPSTEETDKAIITEEKVDGEIEHTAADGQGPVNALDKALRKALIRFYPELDEIYLIDYKVRVLGEGDGTSAKVRVLIESGDHHN